MKSNANAPLSGSRNGSRVLVILSSFLLYYLLLKGYIFPQKWFEFIEFRGLRMLCFHLICFFPPAVALLLLYPLREIPEHLGMNRRFRGGMGIAVAASLPMIIGNALIGEWRGNISFDTILVTMVYAAFFEELVFRGFLFGLLFRDGGWGFVPATLVGGLFFGIAHMYQGHDLLSALAAFGVTALGGLFFSWIYTEWNFNLWVSVGLHLFMNASWILFGVAQGAVGNMWSNVFRILTIGAAIGVTLLYKRKNRLPFAVCAKTLWVNKAA